jgi:predicted transcriptional regulator
MRIAATRTSKRATRSYHANTRAKAKTHDQIYQEIVQIIGRRPGVRQAEIRNNFSITHRAIQQRLIRLEAADTIFSLRVRRRTHYFLKDNTESNIKSCADSENNVKTPKSGVCRAEDSTQQGHINVKSSIN